MGMPQLGVVGIVGQILGVPPVQKQPVILRLLNFISRHLKRRDICREDGQLYLSRFRIYGFMPGDTRAFPFSIYLHKFHTPDYDPAPHSHPWKWAYSFVLTGGYLERRFDPRADYTYYRGVFPGSINKIKSDTFHVVEELLGRETWTLFLVGPRVSSWGFWTENGLVPWQDRFRQRGLDVPPT